MVFVCFFDAGCATFLGKLKKVVKKKLFFFFFFVFVFVFVFLFFFFVCFLFFFVFSVFFSLPQFFVCRIFGSSVKRETGRWIRK